MGRLGGKSGMLKMHESCRRLALKTLLALICLAGLQSSAIAQAPPAAVSQVYRIGAGDKLKIVTFAEDRFSGEFAVHSDGNVAFPMIGNVRAQGLTAEEIAGSLTTRLAPDYLRDPRITVEVIAFKPVNILGEVAKPGQYQFAEGMTLDSLVALAGGFSYRANKKRVFLRHDGEGQESRQRFSGAIPVAPGDTVRIGQRIF